MFESIARSKVFVGSTFIVFFTKIDIFRENVGAGYNSLSKFFPDYDSQPTDIVATQEFITNKFRDVGRAAKKEVRVHYVNNLDAESVKEAVADFRTPKIDSITNSTP